MPTDNNWTQWLTEQRRQFDETNGKLDTLADKFDRLRDQMGSEIASHGELLARMQERCARSMADIEALTSRAQATDTRLTTIEGAGKGARGLWVVLAAATALLVSAAGLLAKLF